MRAPFHHVFVTALWTMLVRCDGSTNSTNTTMTTSTGSTSTIKIMTFNIWGDGGGQPLEQTASVIQAAGANIVGLQESHSGTADALAELLGWEYVLQHGDDVALISEWDIVGSLNNPQLGGRIQYDETTVLYVINVHLAHCPYEPYQLLDIPYCGAPTLDKTEEAAIASAQASRRAMVNAIGVEVDTILRNHDSTTPLIFFILGDFNEPSHHDWTEQAAQAGRHPLKVAWPTTAALENDFSFQDAYRVVHPDEMEYPGYTWTPTTSVDDPNDHHDRIDYVLYYYHPPNQLSMNDTTTPMIQVTDTAILGPDSAFSDVVVQPYPSDHRALVAAFLLPPEKEDSMEEIMEPTSSSRKEPIEDEEEGETATVSRSASGARSIAATRIPTDALLYASLLCMGMRAIT